MIMLRAHARLAPARVPLVRHPFRGCASLLGSHLENPFNVLGLSRDATEKEIREKYLDLAKQHHPDASSESGVAFAKISAAYHTLSDPQLRHKAELELQDPTERAMELAGDAVLQCRSGQTGHGLHLMADVLTMWDSYHGGGGSALACSAARELADAASLVLELSAARGEPHHRPATSIWSTLCRWSVADSRACQAYFALALRGGNTPDAMRALRHAEQCELKQSNRMINTARQVRKFKQRQRHDRSCSSS